MAKNTANTMLIRRKHVKIRSLQCKNGENTGFRVPGGAVVVDAHAAREVAQDGAVWGSLPRGIPLEEGRLVQGDVHRRRHHDVLTCRRIVREDRIVGS
eukprot:3801872-Pyramimonas_sp.AAC.2